MKITVVKSALLEALQAVQNVVAIRSPLPILSNVLLTAEDGKLWMTTTDLDVTMRCNIDIEIAKPGSSTLPVRRFTSIIRELPDASIQLEIDDKNIAKIECAASYFKINGLSEEEFPPMPKPEGMYTYHLDQNVFKEMLRKTVYAASADETRFVLNGVLLSFKAGKLTMVATDGRRLALVEQEVEFPVEAEADMILPTKTVNELLHVLGDEGELKVYGKENLIMFEFGDISIASKLIDGTYPNYRQVIPAQCEERVTVERESLFTALRRAALLTTDKSNATKLTFANNKLVIATTTPDIGEARETVPLKYSGKEISVAFNPEFMMDPLKTLDCDEIYIELTDDLSPGIIKCDIPFLYVLMPMRVT